MNTLHQQVGSYQNLTVGISQYGTVIAYAIERGTVLGMNVFGETLNETELSKFCYFCHIEKSMLNIDVEWFG